jgi:single-strand DNA-binding protein
MEGVTARRVRETDTTGEKTMARSLNQCSFIGNLGKDVEIRAMPNGKAVANFSVAVADSYKDKQTGEQVDQTEWVRCVAFDRLAETCGQYLHKGSKVYVQGRMKTRKWQDQSGADRYSTEIVLDNMQMLDSRTEGAGQAPRSSQSAAPAGGFDSFDDGSDIPF